MKLLKNKIIKITLGITLIFFLSKYAIELQYGHIDYSRAFEAAYQEAENGKTLMKTDWYQMKTDRRWLNFGYDADCVGRGGYLISAKGVIEYDYSMFAPDFATVNVDSTFRISEDTVMNTAIRMIESADEFGIFVYRQEHKGMDWQLLLWPSKTGKNLKRELIEMMATMEFTPMKRHEFYNFN